jgi:hypothetical protein
MSLEELERELKAQLGPPVTVSSPKEVGAVWRLNGFEVAICRDPVPARSRRRLWKEREGGRGLPLLLVIPDPMDALRLAVVGPRESAAEPRSLRGVDLARVIVEYSSLAPNAAARALEAALEHLGRAAVPGVLVHGLLTDHYIRRRLNARPERAELAVIAEPALKGKGWQQRLSALGYDVRQEPRHGYVAYRDGQAIAVVHAYSSASLFSRMDESGRLPEGVLISDCEARGVPWGMLAAGDQIRLFETRPLRGAATDRWLELDAANLEPERAYLLGLLAPASLRPGGVLSRLLDDAKDFGTQLRERLDDQIRKFALPDIARGLGDWLVASEGADLHGPDVRREVQQATYTLLFRLLFVLYAESAGYLPYERSAAYRRNALRTLCNEARERLDRADARSTYLWDRLRALTNALRNGDKSMEVPPYNGSLFAPDGLAGAALLERASISDTHLAPALDALGFDYTGGDDAGLDYADLEIAHLGAIYEGLLALRLSLADQTYRWDDKRDRFVPDESPGEYGVAAGQLFFQTEAGGRKGAGVYYTRQEVVRHLVNQAVLPALEEHLEQVQRVVAQDPAAAARLLFRFRVLDPAMGSAHFLVDALDVIADRVQKFLATTPLPQTGAYLDDLRAEAGASAELVEDGRLLRRLLLKHCIYGVDLQEMAVELARVALWLASFVPGLSLAYLDHNLQQGDSLVGVANPSIFSRSSGGRTAAAALWAQPAGPLDQVLERAGKLALEMTDMPDRTPAEVRQSKEKSEELDRILSGARRAFGLWTAEAFGVAGARKELDRADAIIRGEVDDPKARALLEKAQKEGEQRHFFHWPLAFPEVFHPSSERNPGFDAVIGNPPWEEITIEELGFFALHDPGLRGLTAETERRTRIERLLARYPELHDEFEARKLEIEVQRSFFRPENGYEIQGSGDLDLYELFCERYQALARAGGRIGVVQPRSTFLAAGSRGFRRWLLGSCSLDRVDFLLNAGRWAFDMEPRYTIALMAVRVSPPPKGAAVTVSGPSAGLEEFLSNAQGPGVRILLDDLARWTPTPLGDPSGEPSWEVPLLPTHDHARVLARMRRGPRFDRWAQAHGGVFPVRELDETNHRRYFRHKRGLPVWKGRSFDQYDPHGRDPAGYADWDEVLAFLQQKRLSARSGFAARFPRVVLSDPATHPVHRSRVAFRDVSRATDSRTVRACLGPPRTPLTNKAPYLVFPGGDAREQAYVLGVLNSLPFDWQARRFVETTLNFFILNLLCLPPEDSVDMAGIARRAARLSCADSRFAEFAGAIGVPCGPLTREERDALRAEIDALVARAYGLTADDLEIVFSDFTLDAVSPEYRALVRRKFEELVP